MGAYGGHDVGDEYSVDGRLVRVVPRRRPDGWIFDLLDETGDPLVEGLEERPDLDEVQRLLAELEERGMTLDDLAQEREYD